MQINSKRTIWADIIKMILPLTIQNILELGIGVLTMAVIGRLSALDISAKGISERIVQFDWSIFRGLGTGAMLLLARAFGQGDQTRYRTITVQSYLICIPLSFLYCLVIQLIPRQLLSLQTEDPIILEKAVLYTRILAMSSPFTAVMAVNTAAFNGKGDTRTPMLIAVVMNVINIVLCYVFVFGMGPIPAAGLQGSAAATMVSKLTAAVLGLVLVRRKGLLISVSSGSSSVQLMQTAKGVFSGGIPVALETIFWQFSAILLTRAILSYGSNAYAAYLLGLQAETLMEAPAFGFSVATMTLCSIAIARKDLKLYQQYIRHLLLMVFAIGLATTAAMMTCNTLFMRLLTDKPELIAIGAGYIRIMGFGQAAQAIAPVFMGILRASGHKICPAVAVAFGIWGARIPVALISAFILNAPIQYIWGAIAVDPVVRLILSVCFFCCFRCFSLRGEEI